MTITYAEKSWSDREIFKLLNPVIRKWFKTKFGSFTPPQKYAVPLIHKGENVLIFSPTGSGKTLSAFLSIINELYELDLKGELEDKVYCVYVSPLRALSNDIRRNLEEPLREISKLAGELGYKKPEIRVAVRTGDTPQSQRSKMLRKPPHILITTPESLAIVLNAPKFSQHLKGVRWVIIDEVHELSDNKRGVHLSLSLERLQDLVGEREFVRIGLSATQAPVEEIAKWLVGYRDDGANRPCKIVNVYFTKKLDIKVLAPVKNLLGASFEEATEQMYHLIKKLIDSHRTTLIFTNTRSGAERVSFKLMELYGKEQIDNLGTHHSSLGRQTRLEVEEKLKRGEMKAVVSSSSLELGIDIGYIDLVIQIGSPKSVAKGLQRIGRSGHALNKPSKGRIIVFDRDDLVECAVLVKAAYDGKIDRVQIPKNALDVLAQHIVGMSLTRKWTVEEAYRLVKRSYNYHDLPFEKFMAVIRYLAGHYAELEERQVYRKIWFDEEEGVFGRKRSSRMIYYLNLGTIPDEADFTVVSEYNNRVLGHLSEPFVEKLTPGDVFVLGGKTYIFKRVRGTRVIVEPAHGRRPTVPSWVGEMLPRSFDLSIEIGKFREKMEDMLREGVPDEEIIDMLVKDYRVDKNSAISILEYMKEQLAVAGLIPSHKRLVIEEYIDQRGRQNIIFHFLFGRRTNDALSKAYAYVISKKIKGNVATSLTDNGFMLTLPEGKRIDLEDVPKLLRSNELKDVLKKAIFNTELFKNRFRHVAARSFMILRKYKSYDISVSRQQLKSQQVLTILKKKFPDFPVLQETYREILEDYMDVQHAQQVLEWIENGESEVIFLRSGSAPSPFSHSIILVGAEDVVILEDRDALLRELHRRILEKVLARKIERKPKFEATLIENLFKIRQHLTPDTKGKSKKDILMIIEDVGPLYLFREKKPSIFERVVIDKEKAVKYAKQLLESKRIISLRLPNGESRWILTRDFPVYHKALKGDYKLDKLARRILKILEEKGEVSTDELMKNLQTSYSDLRFSLKVLEQNRLICKKGFKKKGKDEVVIWTTTDNYLGKTILKKAEELDEKQAIMILAKKYIASNVVVTPEELSNITGRDIEAIREILEEMEKSGELISGYFYALKEAPQYMLYSDYQLLESQKSENLGKVYPEKIVLRYLTRKHALTEEVRYPGRKESIIKILNEIGPVKSVLSFVVRMKKFDMNWVRDLMEDGEIVIALGFRGSPMFMTIKQAKLFCSLRRVNSEISDEEQRVLEYIKEKGVFTKNDVRKDLNLESKRTTKIIRSLEEKGYLVRVTNDPLGKRNYKYVYIEVDETNHEALLKEFVKSVIRWYSPIPFYGIKWLTRLPRHELQLILRKLERDIVKVAIRTQYVDEYYMEKSEYKKLEKEYKEYLLHPHDNGSQIVLLSPDDPYALRGITVNAKKSYNVKNAHPIVLNGELIGAVAINGQGKNKKIEEIELNKQYVALKSRIEGKIKELLKTLNT